MNICSRMNTFPSDIQQSQAKTSHFNGQLNESLSLHHTQDIPTHLLRQVQSDPKVKRDISGIT